MRRAAFLLSAAILFPANPAQAQSLDETIAAAIEHSPSLEAAQAREDAAAAALDQARAEHNPSATATGQVGVGRIDPQGFFGLPANDVVPRVAQVSADLPLFTGGRIGAAIDQAKGGAEIAQAARRAAELQLRLDVVQAYSKGLAAREEVAGYNATVKALQEARRQAGLMFEAGAATSTDVAQADARLAEAQAGLAGAEGSLAEAQERLARLAGQPVELQPDLPAPPAAAQSADEAISLAIAGNPQVAQARRAADVAAAAVRGAKAEYLPTVGAYAEASTVRDQFFPGYKADSASVGLRARWTFFSGGRNGAKVDRAEAEARAALADAKAAEQQVEIEAVRSWEAVRTSRAVLAASEKRAAAAREVLRSTRLEVSAGAKPQLALLDAEREAIAAETARIAASGNLLSASYRLRAVTGQD